MPPLILWLEFKIPSANRTRYLHWTRARKYTQQAKEAWLSALQSSDAQRPKLIRIISFLAPKLFETQLREASALTTETAESNGNTASASEKAQKAPS